METTPENSEVQQTGQVTGDELTDKGMKELQVDSTSDVVGAGKLSKSEANTKADDANSVKNVAHSPERTEKLVNVNKLLRERSQKQNDDTNFPTESSKKQIKRKKSVQTKKLNNKKLRHKLSKKKSKLKHDDQEVIDNWDIGPDDFGEDGEDDMSPPYREDDEDNVDYDEDGTSLHDEKAEYDDLATKDRDLEEEDPSNDNTLHHPDESQSDDMGSVGDDVMGHDDYLDEDEDKVIRMREDLQSEIKKLQGDNNTNS